MNPLNTRWQCWRGALCRSEIWGRALKLGLPVGFLQVAVNQGDYWVHHQVNGVVVLKSIISPMIAVSIALFSAAGTHVERQLKNIL